MLIQLTFIFIALAVLVWSADKFVDGASSVARLLGMPSLLVGMIIIGFGTSAPELAVSALAALSGNAGLALGNAYGSNITNIALILGITALISPVFIQSQILKKELPILIGVTMLAYVHLKDGNITRLEAWIELVLLLALVVWMTWIANQHSNRNDELAIEVERELEQLSPVNAWMWLAIGLVLLVASSRMLVYAAVNIAQSLGVSDLIIGLTVVAVGTSLPELASSIMAARKNEHDLVVGNILGSNLFNTLAVVGLAGVIHPLSVPAEVLTRDWSVMFLLTVLLLGLGLVKRSGQPPRINRLAGGLLLLIYAGYTVYLILGAI